MQQALELIAESRDETCRPVGGVMPIDLLQSSFLLLLEE